MQDATRKVARKFLAARELAKAWRRAREAGVCLGVSAELRLVLDKKLPRAEEVANADLWRALSTHGEPVRVGRLRLAIDTEANALAIERRPPRRKGGDRCSA